MKYSLHFIDEVTGYTEINISKVYFKAGYARGTDELLKNTDHACTLVKPVIKN